LDRAGFIDLMQLGGLFAIFGAIWMWARWRFPRRKSGDPSGEWWEREEWWDHTYALEVISPFIFVGGMICVIIGGIGALLASG
jgi:hypothetical protein